LDDERTLVEREELRPGAKSGQYPLFFFAATKTDDHPNFNNLLKVLLNNNHGLT
jgi:hypothetical protein